MRSYIKNFQVLAGLVLALAATSAHAGQTSYFIYDESGHVIGEYDANGNPIQEHIYLGDKPVAVVQNNATLNYVTTDQLDTPRIITNSSQAVVWQWSSDPFGNGQPAGSLTYNLRFPGQYFDAETGHNYNYARDYDFTTGRYIESDPIGLRGGNNSYVYVNDNPLKFADIFGLCKSCRECETTYENESNDAAMNYVSGVKNCQDWYEFSPVKESLCEDLVKRLYLWRLQRMTRKRDECLASCGQ